MRRTELPRIIETLEAAGVPYRRRYVAPVGNGVFEGKIDINCSWNDHGAKKQTGYKVVIDLPFGTWFNFKDSTGGSWQELLELLKIADGGYHPETALSEAEIARLAEAAERAEQEKIRQAHERFPKTAPLLASPESRVVARYLLRRGLPLEAFYLLARAGCRAGIGRDKRGAALFVPIRSPAAPWPLTGWQRIYLRADGSKDEDERLDVSAKQKMGKHKVGDEAAGGFLLFADPRRVPPEACVLVVCEGLETGLAIWAATGYAVLVQFDTGGVKAASVDYLRLLAPKRLIIAADNDDPNPATGKRAGQEAAALLDARLAQANLPFPHHVSVPPREYNRKPGSGGSDWLDGWNAVGAGIKAALDAGQNPGIISKSNG